MAEEVLHNVLTDAVWNQTVAKINRFLSQGLHTIDGGSTVIQCGHWWYVCCTGCPRVVSCKSVFIPAIEVG